jgi:hypothetical protein
MSKEKNDGVEIGRLLAGHNEVMFNVYGFPTADLVNRVGIPKETEQIHLGLTKEFIENSEPGRINLIIVSALQADVMFVNIRKEVEGDLILDEAGLVMVVDEVGTIVGFERTYLVKSKLEGLDNEEKSVII